MLLRSPLRMAIVMMLMRNGAEYLAVSAAAHCSACWAVLFLTPNAPIATQIRAKKRLGAGDTVYPAR